MLITILELIMGAAVICALFFEPQIAEWEQKMFAWIKKKIKDRKAETKRKSFVVIEGK